MSKGIIPVYEVMLDELTHDLDRSEFRESRRYVQRALQVSITAAKRMDRGELIGFLERTIDRLQVTQMTSVTTSP